MAALSESPRWSLYRLFDADEPGLKDHHTLLKSKERMVPPDTDVFTGFERRTALPDDDRADLDDLTSEFLDPAILGITVPPIPRRTLSFFMCHESSFYLYVPFALLLAQ